MATSIVLQTPACRQGDSRLCTSVIWMRRIGARRRSDWFTRENPVRPRGLLVLNPKIMVFGETPPVNPKLRPSGGIPGICGSQNAINVLVNRRSASPPEPSARESQRAVWWLDGEMKSRLLVRENRLEERLSKWERDDKLLFFSGLLALPSNSSPSDNATSLRNGIHSSAGCFPCRG